MLDRLSTLSDPTRVRILALLERNELTVTELRQALQLPQSTTSRHLKILSDDGWLRARAEGNRRFYGMSQDLDEAVASLWTLVRTEAAGGVGLDGDQERLRAVLRERVGRSREFFRSEAARWEEVRADLFGASAATLALAGLLEPSWTVGDLGAGTGVLTAAMAPHVARAIAVDRSAEMLAAARERLAGWPNADVREGDLEELPIDDGTLDAAFLSLVLHYVADPDRVLQEARRALTRSGRLVLVDMRRHDRERYRADMGHMWLGFAPPDLGARLERAGFANVSVRNVPPDPAAAGPPLLMATARAT